jgi:4-hydroxy-3-methylbut-2-enyl diphosphate reductase IspH
LVRRGRARGGDGRARLDRFGPPIYVRKQIDHNRHVVEQLAGRGVVFIDDEREAPAGARIVFSAHGVSPAVHKRSAQIGHVSLMLFCPLVTKVHREVRRFAADGYDVVLIATRPRGGRRHDGPGRESVSSSVSKTSSISKYATPRA